MGQPNTLYNGPMLDVEPQQLHPQPYLLPPPPGNRTAFDPHHLPENHGQLPYMMTQYNLEHCSSPFMVPSSSARPFPVQDHVPFPNNFERDRSVIMDGPNGGFKRNRATGSGHMGFDQGRLVHGGQPRHTSAAPPLPWLDQHSWNQAHGVPYLQGLNGHQVAAMGRHSAPFMHPPPVTHFQRHHPPPPPPLPPVHMQPASSSNRHSISTTTARVDPGPMFLGPAPPAGIGIYEAHRLDLMRHRLFIRDLPEDELIALGERMGNVGSGLSDYVITDHLKTRTFSSFRSSHSEDHEANFCVICQMDFENEEKIGVLDCCHEYHELCIKKWLMIKNNCPICKSTAIVLPRN